MKTRAAKEATGRVLIAGCGYVGCALAANLTKVGHEVWGLRRDTTALPKGVKPLSADLSVPSSLGPLPAALDHVVYAVSAGGSDDAAYAAAYVKGLRHLIEALERSGPTTPRIVFVSSTAVYAQTEGEWVDESSPARPVHFTGRRLLEGEGLALGWKGSACVLRLGGIYGPGRSRLVDGVRTGRVAYREHPPQYGNRIHRDDAAGALQHLLGLERVDSVYLGVDHDPAPLAEVVRGLAERLRVPLPAPLSDGQLAARSRRTNKRVSSARLRASGYRFAYPTWREGYESLLETA